MIGSTTIILSVKENTIAMQRAPNATCERPSPIKESLLRTIVVPKSEAQSAISVQTINAFLTMGRDKYSVNKVKTDIRRSP